MFLGVVASILTQVAKYLFRLVGAPYGHGLGMRAYAAMVAIITAITYAILSEYGYIEAVLGVLATAGGFYSFFLKNFEGQKND